MFCPKCGKQIPDESAFCMFCGADLAEFKARMNIEVSPKIEVSAVVEGEPIPKFKPKAIRREFTPYGEVPVYGKIAEYNGKYFCPLCESYGSVEPQGIFARNAETGQYLYEAFVCHSCGRKFLIEKRYDPGVKELEKVFLDEEGVVPVYSKKPLFCTCGGSDFKYVSGAVLLEKVVKSERYTYDKNRYYYHLDGRFFYHFKCLSCYKSFLIAEPSFKTELGYLAYAEVKLNYGTKPEIIEFYKMPVIVIDPPEGVVYYENNYGVKRISDIKLVRPVCDICKKEPAILDPILKIPKNCSECGRKICTQCSYTDAKGKIVLCKDCGQKYLCRFCGKYIATTKCSSCGTPMCDKCASGWIRKKCPNCK